MVGLVHPYHRGWSIAAPVCLHSTGLPARLGVSWITDPPDIKEGLRGQNKDCVALKSQQKKFLMKKEKLKNIRLKNE